MGIQPESPSSRSAPPDHAAAGRVPHEQPMPLRPAMSRAIRERRRRGSLCRIRQRERPGFTLVEVLIVVAVVAILAAVVIPQFTTSTTDAKDAVLMRNLHELRAQIEIFKAHHNGKAPGAQGSSELLHLLAFSNAAGQVSMIKSAAYPYGPYFLHGLPQNPFNGGTGLKPSTNPAGETPNHALTHSGMVVGWFYDKNTGRIAPNAEGNTSSGAARISL